MDPATGPEPRARRWVRGYAQASLPVTVRALSWVPALAAALALLGPNPWRWPLVAAAIIAIVIHVWGTARAMAHASTLLPAFTEIAAFANEHDEVLLVRALARLHRERATPLVAGFPAAVAAVIAETQHLSCAHGHADGCAHRRTTAAWQTWLTAHHLHPAG